MVQKMWDYLIERKIVTVEELELVAYLLGYNEDTMESVLYAREGYNSFDQLDDWEEEEEKKKNEKKNVE